MSFLTSFRSFLRDAPWHLWTSQLAGVLSIELRKNLLRRRSIWLYIVAFFPMLMILAHVLYRVGHLCDIDGDTLMMATIFQGFYLRLGLFFGCMGLFTWLFRGEIVEKSLHYYFLSPIRREVLVAGKFLAGLATSAVFFRFSVLLSFLIMYRHFGAEGLAFMFSRLGAGHLLGYLATTVLACVGYGALFLALSLVAKNPVLPGIAVLLWETFHAVFPAMLQRLSITFYLKQLCPVDVPPDRAA